MQHVLGRFLVIGDPTQQDVSQRVAAAVAVPVGELRQSVRVVIPRLIVDNVFKERAEFQRVRPLNLSHVVAEVDQMLGSEKDRIESARVEECWSLTPGGVGGNLVQPVLEEPLEWNPE